MTYQINEPVHLSTTGPDGSAVDVDIPAGTTDLAPEVADLLVAQGIASKPTTKASKAASTTPEA